MKKSEKRKIGEAKQAANREAERQRNLMALEKDRERRAKAKMQVEKEQNKQRHEARKKSGAAQMQDMIMSGGAWVAR